MSETYRRLRDGIPETSGYGGHFLTDARKVKGWVDALPRANMQATQQELETALDSLASQKLDGGSRQSVLEELRPAILETIALLEQQFSASALPLPPARVVSAGQAERLHVLLGHGYRKAAAEICAPSGNIPMLRGAAVAQALTRSAWHYCRALALAWRIYRAPASGCWQGLHRVHRFASELKLDTKSVEDKLVKTTLELRWLYLETLLMAVANPFGFSQTEQDSLWPVARGYARRCGLSNQSPDDNAPAVPEDADRGPGPGASDESHALWIDLRPYAEDVDAALKRQRDGYSELVPGRGFGTKLSVDVLQRLRRAFGLAAARSFARLQAGHNLDTVIGLSALHFYVSGQRDFDAFMRQAVQHTVHVVDRATWAHGGTDAIRVPRIPAKVLDQSLGGYRMAWENANQVRARVGELVGISMADEDENPEWMVGVVRWLRYEQDGGLSAGVELMSRRARAVGLRVHGENGHVHPPMRAIEIHTLDAPRQRCFLAPSTLESESGRIEVVHDMEDYMSDSSQQADLIARLEVLLNAGDYVLLRSSQPTATGAASGATA